MDILQACTAADQSQDSLVIACVQIAPVWLSGRSDVTQLTVDRRRQSIVGFLE